MIELTLDAKVYKLNHLRVETDSACMLLHLSISTLSLLRITPQLGTSPQLPQDINRFVPSHASAQRPAPYDA